MGLLNKINSLENVGRITSSLVFVGGRISDLTSTYLGLKYHEMVELNPLAHSLIDKFGFSGSWISESIMLGVTFTSGYFIEKKLHVHNAFNRLIFGVGIFSYLAAIQNISQF